MEQSFSAVETTWRREVDSNSRYSFKLRSKIQYVATYPDSTLETSAPEEKPESSYTYNFCFAGLSGSVERHASQLQVEGPKEGQPVDFPNTAR